MPSTVQLYQGDALHVLRTLPDNSIDAIVTDPPYGLSNTTPAQVTEALTAWVTGDRGHVPAGRGFMGATWDGFVPPPALWDEAYRVLKPGGHALVFAGSRTQDLMGISIRLAGFDLRDSIAWLYGSGFPKSLDISKQIDKTNGEAGRLHKFTAWMRTTGLTSRQLNEVTGTAMGSHYLTAASQPAIPTPDLWAKIRPLVEDVPAWVDELVDRIEAEREVIAMRSVPKGHAFAGSTYGGNSANQEYADTTAATEAAKRWQGWGTALKPAHEPIILARKPIRGTVAANTLEWGTGGINVDACRIAGNVPTTTRGGNQFGVINDDGWEPSQTGQRIEGHTAGRWPTNVALDEDAAADLDKQSGTSKAGTAVKRNGVVGGVYSPATPAGTPDQGYGDAGGASRFFYVAKAPTRERPTYTGEDGQKVAHPTVKPVTLIEHLVKLITPPGGTVLDMFAGSGTTGEAAIRVGIDVILVEAHAPYVPLIQQRIDRATEQKGNTLP